MEAVEVTPIQESGEKSIQRCVFLFQDFQDQDDDVKMVDADAQESGEKAILKYALPLGKEGIIGYSKEEENHTSNSIVELKRRQKLLSSQLTSSSRFSRNKNYSDNGGDILKLSGQLQKNEQRAVTEVINQLAVIASNINFLESRLKTAKDTIELFC